MNPTPFKKFREVSHEKDSRILKRGGVKRLLIISPEYFRTYGGVAGYLRKLAAELSKYMKVDILTAKDSGGTFISQNENLSIYRYAEEWDIFDFFKIMNFINKNNYDFINIQYVPNMYGWNGVNFSLFLFYLWTWLKRKNIFTYCHEVALPFSFRCWYWFPFAIFNRLLYTFVVFFSKRVGLPVKYWKDRSANIFFWIRKKFILIPVFSNFKTIELPETERQKLKKRFDIKEDEKILFFLGGVHPSKLVGYVIDALDYTLKKGHRVKLVCAGFQTEMVLDFLKSDQQHLKNKIITTGIIPEKALMQLLSISDIYLCPYADGISTRRTSAMIGMQSGHSIVSTYGHNTDTKLFARKKDVLLLARSREEFLEEVEFLLNDKSEREELGRRMRQFYENNFSLDIVVDYYLNILLKNK